MTGPPRIATLFDVGRGAATTPVPGGHINESWRVDSDRGAFLLQRLNPRVFSEPQRVMENIAHVTDHLARERAAGRTRREVLELVRTAQGAAWLEEDGACWRMYRYVDGAHAHEHATNAGTVGEAAAAFGELAQLLARYDGPPLHETIAAFHDTPARLAALDDTVRRDPARRARDARAEIDAIVPHADLVTVLPPRLGREVPRRIAHNDAKLGNVLLDDTTGRSRCVVDLDTVMPGSLLFDFGDLVRSMTTPTPEDAPDLGQVGVRLELFEAVATSFLGELREVLTAGERALLVHAGLLITFEQALRFLTDYLAGDRYYRVSDPEQNLRRARSQLRHLATLVAARADLEAIVERAARQP